MYHACCGELICNGCIIAQKRTLIIGSNVTKPIAGSKGEDLEFITILSSKRIMVCPFCRSPTTNAKEFLKRLWNQIDEYKDPEAMNMLGCCYMKGEYGLSKNNIKKGEELYKRSYDLGNPTAARNLFVLYTKDIPDEARMLQYAEEGARRGNVACINAVGAYAHRSGNTEEATLHFMMAACSGDDEAIHNLTEYYRRGVLSKDDLATTLRANQAAHDKETSESREYSRRYWNFREKALAAGLK